MTLADDFLEHTADILTELREVFTQDIVYEAFASRDQYSAITYATAVTLKCRVRKGSEVVVDPSGVEVVAQQTAMVDSGALIFGNEDRFTLPDGTQPEVLMVERVADEASAFAFTRVHFGRTKGLTQT